MGVENLAGKGFVIDRACKRIEITEVLNDGGNVGLTQFIAFGAQRLAHFAAQVGSID